MERFNYKNLKMKNGIFYDIQKFEMHLCTYHNGYIFLNKKINNELLEKIINNIVEVTFDEDFVLGNENYRVLGFDTAHYYNVENPETQTYKAVEETIYNIIGLWNQALQKEELHNLLIEK